MNENYHAFESRDSSTMLPAITAASKSREDKAEVTHSDTPKALDTFLAQLFEF